MGAHRGWTTNQRACLGWTWLPAHLCLLVGSLTSGAWGYLYLGCFSSLSPCWTAWLGLSGRGWLLLWLDIPGWVPKVRGVPFHWREEEGVVGGGFVRVGLGGDSRGWACGWDVKWINKSIKGKNYKTSKLQAIWLVFCFWFFKIGFFCVSLAVQEPIL